MIAWMFFFVGHGLDLKILAVGNNQSALFGSVLSNFAFITTTPSFINELSLTNKILVIIVNIVFPISVLVTSVPVFAIVIRYNLVQGDLCSNSRCDAGVIEANANPPWMGNCVGKLSTPDSHNPLPNKGPSHLFLWLYMLPFSQTWDGEEEAPLQHATTPASHLGHLLVQKDPHTKNESTKKTLLTRSSRPSARENGYERPLLRRLLWQLWPLPYWEISFTRLLRPHEGTVH
ncbi:hypothetical protein BDZ45DRAFT_753807 [Acephala macrosclerotiorum]|nr:hypothetical protein BDZ45DRAFT_753807 [Acephala macrosclerotiorum]